MTPTTPGSRESDDGRDRGDGIERELKIPLERLDEVERRLEALGARPLGPCHLEHNQIFDRAGELAARGEVVRLRQVQPWDPDGRSAERSSQSEGGRLTFKGPARFEGSVKERREIEVAVDSFETTAALLSALGFVAVRRYEKRRQDWELRYDGDTATIALDETPLGCYVEVECREPEPVARALDLDPERSLRASYLGLWDEYRAAHPEAPLDMLFERDPGRA